ncbi:MAG TPA: SOS response-associated peptidase family protein [Kofleriaceae bacterium]|nr:SOS response-associated peptidase family protein [Kofleriaceae bacterium]
MAIERITDTPHRFNLARGDTATVSVGGESRVLRWGLLAPWRGHGGKRPPPIYVAESAAIAATPVLRRASACSIRADGFYARYKRRAFWIHGATAFAGLVATHGDDGVESFAIVVEPAPPAIAAITAMVPIAAGASWRAIEVATDFASHDDARCIAPVGNPNQGELF